LTPVDGVEQLYRREHARILAMCLAMLGDAADAEDALQETFARVAARFDTLKGDPAGYLVVVARNVCRDELRRRRRAPVASAAADQTVVAHPADDVAVERSLLEVLWGSLSTRDRALFAGVVSGESLGEIADRAGLSADTVAQRISRARRRMRRLISAPAVLLGPVVLGGVQRLSRRMASIPSDVVARVHQSEPLAAPLLIGLAIGLLGGPVSGSGAPAHPPDDASLPRPNASAGAAAAAAPISHGGAAAGAGRLQDAALVTPSHPAPVLAMTPPADGPRIANTQVTSFTASPAYSSDHTVFATGTCPVGSPRCSPLFRSDDGGRAWRAIGGAGLVADARILLPPDFHGDSIIFAAAPGTGLLRSADGGAHFAPVTPALNGIGAVVDPRSPPGDPHVYLTAQSTPSLLVYTDHDRSLAPVTGLPPDVEAITALFSGPGAHAAYVSVAEAIGGGSLWACASPSSCSRVGPGVAGIPIVSPTFAVDHTYFTLLTNGVRITDVDGTQRGSLSTDGAQAMAVVAAADYSTSQRLDVVVRHGTNATDPLAVLRYLVAAHASASAPGGWTAAMDFDTVARLPDGRVLVGLRPMSGSSDYGIACSSDDGTSFAPTC